MSVHLRDAERLEPLEHPTSRSTDSPAAKAKRKSDTAADHEASLNASRRPSTPGRCSF